MNRQIPAHRTVLVRVVAFATFFAIVALTASNPLFAQNVMEVETLETAPGGTAGVRVLLTNDQPVQGYQCAMTFDNQVLTLIDMDIIGLDIESALAPDTLEFFLTTIDNTINPSTGWGAVAAIFDSSLPFNGQVLPPGVEQSIVRYNFDVASGPGLIGTCTLMSLTDGFGPPPGINNVLTIGASSVAPTRLDGQICFIDLPTFIRGDLNQDTQINLADGIFVLQYLFSGGQTPACFDAGDFNDDEQLDISDVISMLSYQFTGGAPPAPPFPGCGVDPTGPDVLSCLLFPTCGTFNPIPLLNTVTPNVGNPSGGETVILTGSDFTFQSRVFFGGVEALSVIFTDSTTVSAVTPPSTPGTVDVQITTQGGASTLTDAFTFAAAPIPQSVTPAFGSIAGGDTVTINGAAFTVDTTATIGGVAAAVTFVNSNSLSVVTPANPVGVVDIELTNSLGSSTLASAFTYVTTPTLAAVTPVSGSTLGGDTVTLNGSNFSSDASVSFDGVIASSVSVTNSTTLTCDTPPHAEGAVNVVITNAAGSDTLLSGYTYVAPPSVVSVSPNSGLAAGGEIITITGAGFSIDATATFDGIAAATTFVSATELSAVAPAHAAATVDVTVTNSVGSGTLVGGYTYNDTPTLTAVSPGAGSIDGGTTVTVTGTAFTADATVTFDGLAAATTFVNSTTLSAVTPAHAAGVVDVTVANAFGSSTLTGGYSYIDGPAILSVSPSEGGTAGGDSLTVTGAGFTVDAIVSIDGVAVSTTFVSDSQLTAVTVAHSAATVDVSVNSSFGSANLDGSLYFRGRPRHEHRQPQ